MKLTDIFKAYIMGTIITLSAFGILWLLIGLIGAENMNIGIVLVIGTVLAGILIFVTFAITKVLMKFNIL